LPKTNLLARLYRVKAQILEFLGRSDESTDAARQALEAYKGLPGDNTDVIRKLEEFLSMRTAVVTEEDLFHR